MSDLLKTLEIMEARYANLNKEIQDLKIQKYISEEKPPKKQDVQKKPKPCEVSATDTAPSARAEGSYLSRGSTDDSFEQPEQNVFEESKCAPTPVHTRLIRRGLEQKAKLLSLREQIEEKVAQPNVPKINDTSRRIVEATRRRSGSLKEHRPAVSEKVESDDTWKEYATTEGYLYYYNDRTKETRWERPLRGSIIPYVPSTTKRRYSLDQAKTTLSGK